METSTTVNGLKFYESMQKRATLTHESSNMATHRTLPQFCIRNVIVVSLATPSRPHDLGFCFTLVKAGREKQRLYISAVTVHVYEYSIGPSYSLQRKEGYRQSA